MSPPRFSLYSVGSADREMAGIAKRDASSLRRLFDAHAGRVMAVGMSILRNHSQAEDLVQEVFLEVWNRASEYDPKRGGVVGWLVVLARTRAIDRLRSRRAADRAQDAHPESPLTRISEEPTPLEAAELRQARERIHAALAQLPEAQRTVIRLSYFEGLSQKEICERQGEPLGTVKTRMRLAMEKLQRLLSGRGPR